MIILFTNSPNEQVDALFRAGMLLIAFITLSDKLGKPKESLSPKLSGKQLAEHNYKRLKNKFDCDDQPILKALLFLRSQHPEIRLTKIYEIDKSMFDKKRFNRYTLWGCIRAMRIFFLYLGVFKCVLYR